MEYNRSECLFPPLFISSAMEVAYKEEMIEGENFKSELYNKFVFLVIVFILIRKTLNNRESATRRMDYIL